METKFIEGTNEQYSIREDGVVLCNYRIRFLHDRYFQINKTTELITSKDNTICIKNKRFNVKKLQIKYFNYMFCKKCNDKIYHYVLKGICKNCIQKNRKEWNQKYKKENSQKVSKNIKKYQLNHPEKYKEVVNKSNKKVREKLTKSYVASSLCISVKEMSNELYEHHKSLIFFKREIIKKFGINIQKLV